MHDLHYELSDSTAYECCIKYPPDVKLLCDCCKWFYKFLFVLCNDLGIKRQRPGYVEDEKK